MSTQLPVPHEYDRLAKYPGIRPHDAAIWEEFIRSRPDYYDFVYYDVKIGRPRVDGMSEQEMKWSGAWDVAQWRVDVIGQGPYGIDIIEVKPGALAGAIGQTLAYRALLQHEGLIPDDANCKVLTDQLVPITEQAGKLLGVEIIVP